MLPCAAALTGDDVEDDEIVGFRQRPTLLIACAHEPALLVRPRSVHFPLQAGVDQFEIKHRNFGRVRPSEPTNVPFKRQACDGDGPAIFD